MPHIRNEQPGDEAAIHAIVSQAFGRAAEADLLKSLRGKGKAVVSLVAEEEGQVLGQVLFSPIVIEAVAAKHAALGLAPLAVLPAFQRLGIGSALVSAGLARCRELGHTRVVVLGEPAYYARFGFSPAAEFGIRYPGDVPGEAFMALALVPGALDRCAGVARYSSEFENL
jgi:putative acetyltransferase